MHGRWGVGAGEKIHQEAGAFELCTAGLYLYPDGGRTWLYGGYLQSVPGGYRRGEGHDSGPQSCHDYLAAGIYPALLPAGQL